MVRKIVHSPNRIICWLDGRFGQKNKIISQRKDLLKSGPREEGLEEIDEIYMRPVWRARRDDLVADIGQSLLGEHLHDLPEVPFYWTMILNPFATHKPVPSLCTDLAEAKMRYKNRSNFRSVMLLSDIYCQDVMEAVSDKMTHSIMSPSGEDCFEDYGRFLGHLDEFLAGALTSMESPLCVYKYVVKAGFGIVFRYEEL